MHGGSSKGFHSYNNERGRGAMYVKCRIHHMQNYREAGRWKGHSFHADIGRVGLSDSMERGRRRGMARSLSVTSARMQTNLCIFFKSDFVLQRSTICGFFVTAHLPCFGLAGFASCTVACLCVILFLASVHVRHIVVFGRMQGGRRTTR